MKKGSCMPMGKASRQQSKLLMKTYGSEMDQAMNGSFVEKMRLGNNAKRLVKMRDGNERMQAYKLGGGTHNTYSGK
tara:strand:+ start:1111 stop:1338 length:228 start_codon:yes stop_codon:yes gene_type:complete